MLRMFMGRGARVGLPLVLLVLVVLYGLVSFFIAQGVTKADRDPQEDHPSNFGLAFEDVEFLSRRGDVMIRGWYLSEEDSSPHPIFITHAKLMAKGIYGIDIGELVPEGAVAPFLNRPSGEKRHG